MLCSLYLLFCFVLSCYVSVSSQMFFAFAGLFVLCGSCVFVYPFFPTHQRSRPSIWRESSSGRTRFSSDCQWLAMAIALAVLKGSIGRLGLAEFRSKFGPDMSMLGSNLGLKNGPTILFGNWGVRLGSRECVLTISPRTNVEQHRRNTIKATRAPQEAQKPSKVTTKSFQKWWSKSHGLNSAWACNGPIQSCVGF